MTDDIIPRGADLTEADLTALAEDMFDIGNWARRVGLKRPAQVDQMRRTMEARLGRRPLVMTPPGTPDARVAS